jgi:hypothetical protein
MSIETSLHRQLKRLYGGVDAQFEAQVGRYRIDVRSGGQLVEIQHGALAAIRDKIRALVERHEVLVVKPIVARKVLVRLAAKGGAPIGRRTSPKQGKLLDLFGDLVHFTNVFPHPRLTLEVPLVEVEEHRYPGHGRRRRWSRADFEVEDQRLLSIAEVHRFHTAQDLLRLIPGPLPCPFDTGDLARLLGIPRGRAQQVAYCLERIGAVRRVGKRGNARLYEVSGRPRPARRRRARLGLGPRS